MKNTNRKMNKKNKLAAMLAAVMVATTVSSIGASAQTMPVSGASEKTAVCVSAAQQNNRPGKVGQRIRWDDENEKKDNSPDNPAARTRTIRVKNSGWYSIKNLKIYGRMASNLAEDGSLGPGKWVQLTDTTSMAGLGFSNFSIDIPTAYESFALSFDVVGGTDFPYSGVFWTDNDCTRLEEIQINISGTCRMADVKIMVGDKTVVDESNCSSHSEWNP